MRLLKIVRVSHNRLRQLPHSIPASVREFLADENLIQRVFSSNFAPGAALRTLSLEHNQVEAMAANTFQALGNLTSLKLAWNNITALEGLAFGGLNKLSLLRWGIKGSLEVF